MSADIKVRQFIGKRIIDDASQLDLIGTAQLEHDISDKIQMTSQVKEAKEESDTMAEATGSQLSYNEQELKEYVQDVLIEVSRAKQR